MSNYEYQGFLKEPTENCRNVMYCGYEPSNPTCFIFTEKHSGHFQIFIHFRGFELCVLTLLEKIVELITGYFVLYFKSHLVFLFSMFYGILDWRFFYFFRRLFLRCKPVHFR